jgi:hypothetical protein
LSEFTFQVAILMSYRPSKPWGRGNARVDPEGEKPKLARKKGTLSRAAFARDDGEMAPVGCMRIAGPLAHALHRREECAID